MCEANPEASSTHVNSRDQTCEFTRVVARGPNSRTIFVKAFHDKGDVWDNRLVSVNPGSFLIRKYIFCTFLVRIELYKWYFTERAFYCTPVFTTYKNIVCYYLNVESIRIENLRLLDLFHLRFASCSESCSKIYAHFFLYALLIRVNCNMSKKMLISGPVLHCLEPLNRETRSTRDFTDMVCVGC